MEKPRKSTAVERAGTHTPSSPGSETREAWTVAARVGTKEV